MAITELDQAIEQYHRAMNLLVGGSPGAMLAMMSQRDDVSLANPLGPAVRGRTQVVETVTAAAANFREAEPVHFERIATVVTPDLAFIVEVERCLARVGERKDFGTIVLRSTTIFRPEDGTWRIVHRHADAISSKRPVESILLK